MTMLRVWIVLFTLLFGGASAIGARAQQGASPFGKLTGDGMELEWQISGAETGGRFFADRTWQANGTVTAGSVRFSGILRVSVPGGLYTDASMSAYIAYPMGAGSKVVKWSGELSDAKGLSRELPFDLTLDALPGRSILVSASAGKTGGVSDLLAVTFQFAPLPKAAPVAEANPNEPYWVWVRAQPPRIYVETPGESGSAAVAVDGAAFVKSYLPGDGAAVAPRTLSAIHRWKLPLWLKAGAPVPVEFAIDKIRYRWLDAETAAADKSMTIELDGFVTPPGGNPYKQRETFSHLTKFVADTSPDVLAPTPVKIAAPLTTPAYAPELEYKTLSVTVLAGTAPRVAIIYQYMLRRAVGTPPDPPAAADPDDPTSPCTGKSAKDRAAMVALGRQMFFDSTYLWLDYATAIGPRKLWWTWSDFKSRYHIEAIGLTYQTVAAWASTGRGAAAALLGAGLAANALEDGVASSLRTLDRAVHGDRVIARLDHIYRTYAANWQAIDKLGTADQRRSALEALGAALNGSPGGSPLGGAVLDLAGYEYYWGRAGSDMTFHGNLMARMYDLHLAERDLGCLP